MGWQGGRGERRTPAVEYIITRYVNLGCCVPAETLVQWFTCNKGHGHYRAHQNSGWQAGRTAMNGAFADCTIQALA